MNNYKDKQTGEIVEAIQFTRGNLHRFENYIRGAYAVQKRIPQHDKPAFKIRTKETPKENPLEYYSNPEDFEIISLGEWLVNRDKSINIYSCKMTDKEFNKQYQIIM